MCDIVPSIIPTSSAQVSQPPKASLLSLPTEVISLILAELDPEFDLWPLREAVPQLHEVIIHSFDGRQVDIDYTLFWCCQNRYEEGLVQVLKRKSDLNRRIVVCQMQKHVESHHCSVYLEETPLAFAVANGHKRIVELLLKNGAKVKFPGKEKYGGSAPIQVAASQGYHEVTTLLFAQANPRDFKRRAREASDALHALTSRSTFHLLRLEGKRPAMTGVDRLATMKVLLKEGADVKAPGFQGRTHLHHIVESAISHDDLNLRTFLDLGVDPNQKALYGNTPLHAAAARTRPYSLTCHHIELLVQFGCPVNSKYSGRQTPLHIAIRPPWVCPGPWVGTRFRTLHRWVCPCICGKSPAKSSTEKDKDQHETRIPKLLIDLGADVNCQNDKGETPLHVLMHHAWTYSRTVPAAGMKLLVDHGADVNMKNDEGEIPINTPVFAMRKVLEKWVSLKRLMDLMKAVVWMRIRLSKMKRHK